MSQCATYAIRSFTVTPGQLTPIVAPIWCNYFIATCASDDVWLQTDPDFGSQNVKPVPKGSQDGVMAPAYGISAGGRFRSGDAICYLGGANGCTVTVTFVL